MISKKPSLFDHRLLPPLLWLAALIMTLLLAVGVFLNAMPNVPQEADFSIIYASGRSLQQGHSLYQHFIYAPILQDVIFLGSTNAPDGARLMENMNPPVFSLFTWPFSFLPIRTAYYTWCALQWVLAALVLCRLFTIYGFCHPLTRPALLCALAAYFPVYANMLIGQVGLFILLPVAMGMICLRTGRDRQAGFWFGIALSLKLFFGFFFIWFLLQKRGRILAYGALAYVWAMFGALYAFGLHDHLNWLKVMQAHTGAALSWNAAIEGVLQRYMGGGAVETYIDWPWGRYAIRMMTLTGSIGALIWLNRQRLTSMPELGWALCIPLLLLITPLGWIYYFPLLFIVAALLWYPAKAAGQKCFTLLLLALALSANPQLITAKNNMRPELSHTFYFGDYMQKDNGEMMIAYDSVFHWFVLPELYTLALILLCLVPLWIAYKSRSTQTGV